MRCAALVFECPNARRARPHGEMCNALNSCVGKNPAAQLAKLGGLLGLSPVAERGVSIVARCDDDPFAG